jgi:prepilin-type N-terminal cleavage/methylation domain-containing protein
VNGYQNPSCALRLCVRYSGCGFTLIELLLVMLIIGLATSLAGPRLFSTYEKIQVQSEEKELAGLLDAVSFRAFIQNRAITVILDEDNVSLDGKPLFSLKHLLFPHTELTFIQSGLCDTNAIQYQAAGKDRVMSLPQL